MKSIILNGIDTTVRLQRYPENLPGNTDIAAFEAALGYTLPGDYRTFLLEYNGGVCELKNIIPAISGYLCDLFGLYPSSDEGLLMKLRLPADAGLTELWGELPPGLLPIGEADSGDMIALQFTGNGSEIVVVDHESEDFTVQLSCPDFTSFLRTTIREPD